MATGSYQISPSAVNSIVSGVSNTASSTGSTVSGLASTVLDGASFAGIGSAVASANSTLQSSLVKGLQSIVQLLQTINQNVGTASANYVAADTAVAQAYGGTGTDTTTQLAQATAPATTTPATTTAATATDPNAPLTADQLAQDPALRARIEQEEDPHDGTPLNRVYTDTTGHLTVGHGFNLDQPGAAAQLAAVGANYTDIRNGTATLTDDQMNQLLTNHINTAVTDAQNYYSGFDQLDPTRQRVLTDMAYNMGGGTLNTFTGVHQALVNGDFNAAANHMQDSLWYRQTGTRAQSLTQSMRTGTGY